MRVFFYLSRIIFLFAARHINRLLILQEKVCIFTKINVNNVLETIWRRTVLSAAKETIWTKK